MSLTNKKISQSYKDLLAVNNSNNGIDGTLRKIEDGEGTQSSTSLSTNNIAVQPASNSSTTMTISDSSGASIFTADTNSGAVKINTTQSFANTQYLRFTGHDIDVQAGFHFLVGVVPAIGTGSTLVPNSQQSLGNGTNPAVPSIGSNADDLLHNLHYVDTNITIDAVNILVTGDSAAGDTINFHLNSLTTGDNATINDFTAITVVADCSDVVTQGNEQFYRIELDIQSANVDAGQYLALTIESDGNGSDYSVNALCRYHFR